MNDLQMDSATAAKGVARLLMIAILIGVVCGAATWLFMTADHYGVRFFWDELPQLLSGVPGWAVSIAIVALMTLVAVVIVVLSKRRPFDMGEAEAEYDNKGRIEYRHVLGGAAFSLVSLFSGAAVGPEAALTDINGGIGTFVAERLGLKPEHVKIMAYAGVAGAFGAFFGAAPVGALLAAELISPKSLSISRTMIVAGLGSGATAWVAYSVLGGEKIAPLLTFPGVSGLRLVDLGLAVILGLAGGVIGLAYGMALRKARVGLMNTRKRPWLAGLAGGAVTAMAAVLSPYLLFSGIEQVGPLISNAATLGVWILIGLGLAKLAFNIWSLSTAYFGGPIFPIIFGGLALGLAINLVVPAIPQGVAVMGIVAGMVVSACVAPLSVTIFLALICDPSLTSVIAIAAVSAYVVRQLLAPTLPGVYRATRAEEEQMAAAEAVA